MTLGRILKWISIWAAGMATTGLVALGVIYSGAFDATATKPHESVVAWATHTAFKQSVKLRAASIRPPMGFTRAQIISGLADYDRNCSACHGAPGIGRGPFAAELNPTPPYLLEASRKWNTAQLYWIVSEGVKMTGMPAWGPSRSDDELWNIVAFLEAMPSITPAQYEALRETRDPMATPAASQIPGVMPSAGTRRFPLWLDLISTASLAVALVCALIILQDIVRRPQKMWIMNVVWPLTALFGGVLWLVGYYRWGRRAAKSGGDSAGPPFAVKVGIGASHCGAGCTLGDLIAEWLVFVIPTIALAFGWKTLFAEKTFAVWVLDYLVAFGVGIAFQYFTIKPMRDLSVLGGLWQAVKADAASISAWQVGMYGLMGALQFGVVKPLSGEIAPVNSTEFWFAMQLAMLAGFCTSYPVNWWLIRSGVKEAM